MSKLDLSQFQIEQSVFQISFDNCYSLWDNAGQLWGEAQKIFPGLQMNKDPQPSITNFVIPNKLELEIKLGSVRFVQLYPQSTLKDFIENTIKFTKLSLGLLEIKNITRLGFRIFWHQEFKDAKEASNKIDFISAHLVSNQNFFGIEKGNLLYPSILFINENDKLKVRFNMKAEKRKYDVDFPFTSWPNLENITKEIEGILIDVDYSTKGIISISQLNVEEWINSSFRVIKRDTQKILDIYGN